MPTHGAPYPAPVEVSNLMPYTWLVRVPLLAGLREADRFAIVGLVGAAMLAGLTVQWLAQRKITRPLIAVVVALAVLESGWSGLGGTTMTTAMPGLDHLISRDRSGSIVVDVPFGERGGIGAIGSGMAPNSLLIATHDGHPRAVSYTAWVTQPTVTGIERHAFYRDLLAIETEGQDPTPGQLAQAKADLSTLGVGWVVEWRNIWTQFHPEERYWHIDRYLRAVGFRRVHIACLIGVKTINDCPGRPLSSVDDQVWLYQYQQ
jgi:hypothetical protein